MDLTTLRSVAKLVAAGLAVGAVLTAAASLGAGAHADAVTWLSSIATVGALVVAIGIYAVQRREQDVARQELLDRLDAQDELLSELARQEPAEPGDADLSDQQRREVERRFGPGSIAATWRTGAAPAAGAVDEPRLVRLTDGQIAAVYSVGHGRRTVVRPLKPGHGRRGRVDRHRGRRGSPEDRED